MAQLEIGEAERGKLRDSLDGLNKGFFGTEQPGKGSQRLTLFAAVTSLFGGKERGAIKQRPLVLQLLDRLKVVSQPDERP